MKNILIIEDEPGVHITLEDRLISEGYGVTIREDGVSGEREAREGSYDLILLDIMLPGRDGYKVCENLREDGITTPIIMITARNSDLDTVIGLRQGADDYVAKPFEMTILLARIEAQLRRMELMTSSERNFHFGDFTLDSSRGICRKGDEEIVLNVQEFKLLEYLVEHEGAVMDRNSILDEVWGYDSESTSRTVDVHIAKLRQKLGESEIPRHITTIRGRGYKFLINP